MSKTCANCRYWIKPEIGDYELEENEPDMHHGKCLAAKFHDGTEGTDDENESIRSSKMIVMDGSGYMAKLKTKSTHYCNEWELQDAQHDIEKS